MVAEALGTILGRQEFLPDGGKVVVEQLGELEKALSTCATVAFSEGAYKGMVGTEITLICEMNWERNVYAIDAYAGSVSVRVNFPLA